MHDSVPDPRPALPIKGPHCCSPAPAAHKDHANPAGTTRGFASTPTGSNYTAAVFTSFFPLPWLHKSITCEHRHPLLFWCVLTQPRCTKDLGKRTHQLHMNLEIIPRHIKLNSLQPPPEKFCWIWPKKLLERTEKSICCWHLPVLWGTFHTSPSAVSTDKIGWTVSSYLKAKLSLGSLWSSAERSWVRQEYLQWQEAACNHHWQPYDNKDLPPLPRTSPGALGGLLPEHWFSFHSDEVNKWLAAITAEEQGDTCFWHSTENSTRNLTAHN